jgi:hypothetical protein
VAAANVPFHYAGVDGEVPVGLSAHQMAFLTRIKTTFIGQKISENQKAQATHFNKMDSASLEVGNVSSKCNGLTSYRLWQVLSAITFSSVLGQTWTQR